MSVVVPKANQDETVLDITPLRKILSDQGLSESCSATDEGFYFVAEGTAEVTIYYKAGGKMRDIGLLRCCSAIAQYGFALTLFLSKRTSALFVRDDG